MVGIYQEKMKLTITGSSGFIGLNLFSYLLDFQIQKLSLRYQPNQEIDLNNTNAIIHLAGKAHDLKKVSQPQDYYEANFELTKQLYDAFLKSEAQKFISISLVKDSVASILTEDQTANQQTDLGYIDSPMLLVGLNSQERIGYA
jgi:nucleoside-diphosphate-sugar epimerase